MKFRVTFSRQARQDLSEIEEGKVTIIGIHYGGRDIETRFGMPQAASK